MSNDDLFKPPYPPYDPTDTSGFSYETVVKRWPIIITNVIDHLHRAIHDVITQTDSTSGQEAEDLRAKRQEGKQMIEQLSKLKYEMGRDKPMMEIAGDGEADVGTYNTELASLREQGLDTWFKAPWLFAECYLYRWMRSLFALTKHWHHHDPFFPSKQDSFRGSSVAIYKLAATMQELKSTESDFQLEHEKIGVIFKEMIQMSLWGNATDLSLLTNLTHDDIRKLQAVGKEAQEERRDFILHDDSDAIWAHLKTLDNARVDFVLDNSGFEVYTDLVFADFLVSCTPYVRQVVFHPKSIPWFVSDVTPPDFVSTFDSLLSSTFFPPATESEEVEAQKLQLKTMVLRWKKYVDSGAFTLSVPLQSNIGDANEMVNFWTTPYPYWNMNVRAPTLFEDLKKSELVIFKGDLNYRKLTGDIKWPASTPFQDAIGTQNAFAFRIILNTVTALGVLIKTCYPGPIAGAFPILSLRTAKADVVVGVDQAKADQLDTSGEKWRVNGKWVFEFIFRVVDSERLIEVNLKQVRDGIVCPKSY